MIDYVVFVRQNGHAYLITTTSSYEDAHWRARQCGGSIMFADDFHRAYKAGTLA